MNTSGGVVLIGVKDDGSIVGQDVADNTRLEISNFIAKFEPPIAINIEYVRVKNEESIGMGTQEMFYPMIKIHDEKRVIMSPRHAEILKIMSAFEDGCATTQILNLMKNPPTDRTLRSDLTALEKQQYIERHGEGRATLWLLKK